MYKPEITNKEIYARNVLEVDLSDLNTISNERYVYVKESGLDVANFTIHSEAELLELSNQCEELYGFKIVPQQNKPMTKERAVIILTRHNKWRTTGDMDYKQDPTELTKAIDYAVEYL